MNASRALRILTASVVLAVGLFAGVPAFGQTPTARVHILLVADTNGTAAQFHGFGEDRINLEATLRQALRNQRLEDRYTLTVLEGADATPAKILNYYQTLPTRPGDALFFYYSGHGGTSKTDGHYLAMAAGNLSRSQVRAAMTARRPRLLVLLTDCCADFGTDSGDGPVATRPEMPAHLAQPVQDAPTQRPGALIRQMLFQQTGVVDVNACQPGKGSDSVYYKGGFFTLTMVRLLNAQPNQFHGAVNGVVQWRTFFVVLQNETLRRVTAAARENQVPVAFTVTTQIASNR
jgi:hypothetical protein